MLEKPYEHSPFTIHVTNLPDNIRNVSIGHTSLRASFAFPSASCHSVLPVPPFLFLSFHGQVEITGLVE